MKLIIFFLKVKFYINSKSIFNSILLFFYNLKKENTKYPKYLLTLEKKLATYFGVKYALTFSNGTTAFTAILYAIGVKKNSKILISKMSFPSVISSILRIGAQPIFLNFDENLQIEKPNQEIIQNANYLLITHAFGIPQNIQIINEYLKINPKLKIIEDNSHSQGAIINQIKTGAFGIASFMSMQGGKAINAGEGGAVLTNDIMIYNRMHYLMHLNRKSNFDKNLDQLSSIGFLGKGRMSPLGAIGALSDLNDLDNRNNKIRKKYKIIYDSLKFIPDLKFPYINNFENTGGYHYGLPVFIHSKETLDLIKNYFKINNYDWPNLDKNENFNDPSKFNEIIYKENLNLEDVFNKSNDLRDKLYFFDLRQMFFLNNYIIKKKLKTFKKKINENKF